MADFCLDPQGWGPVSRVRYAFTPCFQDGILSAVPPVFLFLVGSAQAWQFFQSSKVPLSRNPAIYWGKITVLLVLLVLNVVLAWIRWDESLRWQHDVLYWSAVLKVAATMMALGLHDLEHVRNSSPVPSGVLLFYWLGTILIDGIKVYELIDEGDISARMPYFVLFAVVVGGEVLIFVLEYFVPKGGKEYHLLLQGDEEDDNAVECPTDYADIFSRFVPLLGEPTDR